MRAAPIAFMLAITPAAAIEVGEFNGTYDTLVAERLGGRPSLRMALECDAGCRFSTGDSVKAYPRQGVANAERHARAMAAIKAAYPASELRGCIDLDAGNAESPMACKLDRSPWSKPTVLIVPPPGADILVLWAQKR